MYCSWTYHGPPLCPIHLCPPREVSILWQAHDGFHLVWKSSVVATLITKVPFKIVVDSYCCITGLVTKRLLFRRKCVSGMRGDCFDTVCMGSPAIIKLRLCCYIVYFNYFNNHNHIGVAARRGRGLQPPCKRSRYSNRAVGNSGGTQNDSQTSSLWQIYEANKDSET